MSFIRNLEGAGTNLPSPIKSSAGPSSTSSPKDAKVSSSRSPTSPVADRTLKTENDAFPDSENASTSGQKSAESASVNVVPSGIGNLDEDMPLDEDKDASNIKK